MASHVEEFIWSAFSSITSNEGQTSRQLSADGEGGGVHIAYEDLYASIMFFATVYVGGQFAARLLKMPSLVGEIFVGIFLGPSLANYVPSPISFVMLGEIGLILLVIEAGIDIDLTTLQLIGSRGMLIAVVGSILPIAIAFVIAFALNPSNIMSAVAAGACFGPTSLGIAMNILRTGKLVNTPVGQLIVSAAVIDDMIALIILSQLGALAGEATVAAIVIPIVSALAFLVGGGYIAVFQLPRFLDKFFFPCVRKENHGAAGIALMFLLLFALMPATYYAKSSFLMGAFLSGLVFCRNHDVHVHFVSQFKRLLQWLMRIFFAASIGFQVPIKDFGSFKVIGYGLIFTLALTGKLAVGFMVPNFNNCEKFKGLHLRDCLITGCSMAAEGEFAFVIAVFSKDNDLISPDLYASIVLAVLISTIIPPFALRYTMSHFNKVAKNLVSKAGDLDRTRRSSMLPDEGGLTEDEQEKRLRDNIEANRIIFLCIQIQCSPAWGLTTKITKAVTSLNLEVIDNRSWHSQGADSTLMTEIFVEDDSFLNNDGVTTKTIPERIGEVNQVIFLSTRQEGAKVKVTRWCPGVLQGIAEEPGELKSTAGTGGMGARQGSIKDMLALEASKSLDKESSKDLDAHVSKSLRQIHKAMGDFQQEEFKQEEFKQEEMVAPAAPEMGFAGGSTGGTSMGVRTSSRVSLLPSTTSTTAGTTKRRHARQKMRSTPIIGQSLFDVPDTEKHDQSVELVVGDEVFQIRVMPETIHRIRQGYNGQFHNDVYGKFSSANLPIEQRLEGFVRSGDLSALSEFDDFETDDSLFI